MINAQPLKKGTNTIVTPSASIVASFSAVGGPKNSFGSGELSGGPTLAGEYVLFRSGQHVSKKWVWSRIAWGTPLRDQNGIAEVLIHGKWVNQEIITQIPRDQWLDIYNDWIKPYQISTLPNQWVFNDFGHLTWYMAKDINGNKRWDGIKSEPTHNQFFHTTPDCEAATKYHLQVSLQESHGCIHLKPMDMDSMTHCHYLATGNMVYVHDYQTSAPQCTMTSGSPPYSIHFYPKSKIIHVHAS